MTTAFKPSESSFIERRSITVKPDMTELVNIYGRTFACVEATGEFEMSFNDGGYFACRKGVRWTLHGEDRYDILRFKADVETDVTFYAGVFDFHENVVIPVFMAAKTKARSGPVLIAAGDATILNTVPDGMSYRKSLIIANMGEADSWLEIETPSPGLVGWYPAGVCYGQQSWYTETSEDIRIRNPGASGITCRIVEFFYLI